MPLGLETVHGAMANLSRHRPIFHSEADFQLALAWELQTAYPGATIRLEKRVADEPRVELDILLVLEGHAFGLELKYPKRAMRAEIDSERFDLPEGAGDFSRHEALRDVERLERLVRERVVDSGILVFLTNSADMWQPSTSSRRVLYEQVRLHEGRQISGPMAWGDWGSAGGRPKGGPIMLDGLYTLRWRDYSIVDGRPFRYLAIEVSESDSA